MNANGVVIGGEGFTWSILDLTTKKPSRSARTLTWLGNVLSATGLALLAGCATGLIPSWCIVLGRL